MMAFPGEDYSTIAAIERTGGYRPDDHWEERLRLSREAAVLGGDLGLKGIGTHVGFVPAAGGPRYDVMIDRVRKVAAAFAEHGISLHMETGQERAASLVCFLGDVGADNVFVNFDPANMILYGAGDPIDAVRVLGKHVRHVHVKDATASDKPGEEWGEEVPFGTGAVDAAAFLKALADAGYTGPLAIEREAGAQRAADVKTAIETLRKVTPPAQ
jgi:sugar phosphate isomerase/epimerase